MRTTSKVALALSVSLCTLTACQSSKDSHAGWGYEGDTGPAHWGELSPDYRLASEGKSQSPIDITTSAVGAGGGDVSVQCSSKCVELVNNGHSIQANVEGGATLTTPTGTYELKQFHFHSPSEHTIDGKHAAMEMHMVHLDASGRIAVVGMMIEEGAENAFFAKLWPHIPSKKGSSDAVAGLAFGPGDLLPATRQTWRYTGSLTTPPCSEDVDWTIMRQPLTASAEQIEAFRSVMFHNNRPTQPLNGRVVRSGN